MRQYVTKLTGKCFENAYRSRKPSFDHGIQKLKKCIQDLEHGEKEPDIDESHWNF